MRQTGRRVLLLRQMLLPGPWGWIRSVAMTEPTAHADRDLQAPLRFAFFTELYSPSIGGQEVFFQELAESLVRRGHTVDVYCIGHQTGLPAHEIRNGVRLFRKPNNGRYQKPIVSSLRRSWSQITRYSAWIRGIADSAQHDFYLLNQWPLMHVLALPLRARHRSAVHWCEVRDGTLFRTIQARFPKTVPCNFAVSAAVAAEIGAQSGQSFGVLPSGLEVDRYRNAPRGTRSGILCLGRLFAHKNLPLLVDAFALVADEFEGYLTIAGDGPERAAIESYVARSPITDRVRVLGEVTEEQKIELLSEAAVFGMPSRREGFPRVIAEAMASGLPIVTAGFPENGAKDVVAQYGSGVVCGTEPADFADGLRSAAAEWDRFSQAGLVGAQTLDWSDIAGTLEVRAREVIENAG